MFFETDYARRVDFDRMRTERLEAARAAMAREGLDAMFLLKHENIRYVTGLRPLWFPYVQLRNAALLVRGQEQPICFVNGGDFAHRRATMYWVPEGKMRLLPPLEDAVLVRKSVPAITKALEDCGFAGRRIGLDVTYLYLLEALQEALPGVRFEDCDTLLRKVRVVKNGEEIKLMRIASACVDIGFDRASRAVEPGRRECEIWGEAAKALYGLGMEIPQCSSIVASGDHLAPLARFASERMVRAGELVLMDFGGCFHGMFAEATRTVICGEPNSDQRAIYRAVHEALQAVLKAMRPGNTNEDMHRAAAQVYERHGFGKYALATVLGHSIGVSGWEPPTIGDPSVTGEMVRLEPGMIFSIEPTIIVPGVPGGGGVRLEEEVLVTEEGSEVLTLAPFDPKLL
ncbi:MAG: Xaa-Pro peptidase family protein [Nitrospinota bacterium]